MMSFSTSERQRQALRPSRSTCSRIESIWKRLVTITPNTGSTKMESQADTPPSVTALPMRNCTEAQAILDAYLDEARKLDLTLLVSAESLFRHPDKLKTITSSCRCKILAFYRDPVDAIYSNYNQTVKRHFTTATFGQYCENVLKR